MTVFSREEIEREFQRRVAIQEKDDWKAFGETFTSDAVYVEHHEGTFKGRDKILAWLVPVMDRCRGLDLPDRLGGDRRQSRDLPLDEPFAGQAARRRVLRVGRR